MSDNSVNTLANAESLAVTHLMEYIAAFNSRDLKHISQCLDDNIRILLNGKEVATGKNSILPSYERDFDAGKTVVVTKGPSAVIKGSVRASGDEAREVRVSVSLVRER
mmetsp:Transcript_62564/g.74089  ORF Transcript_62564/g.74089 Transcript_62564/m.74089 type:complete len:108 (-) Transcript_62564:11-334(-)